MTTRRWSVLDALAAAAVLCLVGVPRLCPATAPAAETVGAAAAERPQSKIRAPAFTLVVLGARGGVVDDDLSAYLLAPAGSTDYVCLDAGTLVTGLQRAVAAGAFPELGPPSTNAAWAPTELLREHVKVYLVSHAHLDHVVGLAIAAPLDSPKPVLGLAPSLEILQEHVFNWEVWPNFFSEGVEPALATYRPVPLIPGRQQQVPGSPMTVTAYPLSHGAGPPSTAFVLATARASVLYLGDTGPDEVERSHRLGELWTAVAPEVRARRLRALLIEASYADPRPPAQLFGHLTPRWVLAELRRLATAVDPDRPDAALGQVTVVVTHIKPTPESGGDVAATIQRQLESNNDLGCRFVVVGQGQRLTF